MYRTIQHLCSIMGERVTLQLDGLLRKTITAGVDDLLDNTQRALGLRLQRDEAEALVSFLDVNGDQAVQCEELEVRKTEMCGRERRVWLWRCTLHPRRELYNTSCFLFCFDSKNESIVLLSVWGQS